MRENAPLLLVVAPTHLMVRETLEAFGIMSDGGFLVRPITRFMALRGWRHGMPVIADRPSRWPVLAGMEGAALEHALLTMLNCGRLRLAQDEDLDRFKLEVLQ